MTVPQLQHGKIWLLAGGPIQTRFQKLGPKRGRRRNIRAHSHHSRGRWSQELPQPGNTWVREVGAPLAKLEPGPTQAPRCSPCNPSGNLLSLSTPVNQDVDYTELREACALKKWMNFWEKKFQRICTERMRWTILNSWGLLQTKILQHPLVRPCRLVFLLLSWLKITTCSTSLWSRPDISVTRDGVWSPPVRTRVERLIWY